MTPVAMCATHQRAAKLDDLSNLVHVDDGTICTETAGFVVSPGAIGDASSRSTSDTSRDVSSTAVSDASPTRRSDARERALERLRKLDGRELPERSPPACPEDAPPHSCKGSASEHSTGYDPSWLYRFIEPSAYDKKWKKRARGKYRVVHVYGNELDKLRPAHGFDQWYVLAHCWLHGAYPVQVCVSCSDWKPPYVARRMDRETPVLVCEACAPLGDPVEIKVKAGDWARRFFASDEKTTYSALYKVLSVNRELGVATCVTEYDLALGRKKMADIEKAYVRADLLEPAEPPKWSVNS